MRFFPPKPNNAACLLDALTKSHFGRLYQLGEGEGRSAATAGGLTRVRRKKESTYQTRMSHDRIRTTPAAARKEERRRLSWNTVSKLSLQRRSRGCLQARSRRLRDPGASPPV